MYLRVKALYIIYTNRFKNYIGYDQFKHLTQYKGQIVKIVVPIQTINMILIVTNLKFIHCFIVNNINEYNKITINCYGI